MSGDSRALGRLRVEDARLRDSEGRYVLLRGVNLASRAKRAPYVPIYPLALEVLDRTALEDELAKQPKGLQALRDLGFNVVRLLIFWQAIEPERLARDADLSPAGELYLEATRRLVDKLADLGIACILDFHQDIASETFGGDGLPDFALEPGGKTPLLPESLWELEYYSRVGGARRTLRAFWNDPDLQEAFARTVGRVAARFVDVPSVLGYEIWNEPFGAGIPVSDFEGEVLPLFYTKVIQAIRSADTTALILVEPRVDWTVFGPDTVWTGPPHPPNAKRPETRLALSIENDPGLVFSFHHYDPWTLVPGFHDSMKRKASEWPETFDAMAKAASDRRLPAFLTEHGGMQRWRHLSSDLGLLEPRDNQLGAYVDLQYQEIERKLLSATYWNYDLYFSEEGKDNWNGEDFSLRDENGEILLRKIVGRPYPARASAKPRAYTFDPERRVFTLWLDGPAVQAPSVIPLPKNLYDGGLVVRATGASVLRDPASGALIWTPNVGDLRQTMIVHPKEAPPPPWPEKAPLPTVTLTL